jgi:adenine-specific DNA-methyltransferase
MSKGTIDAKQAIKQAIEAFAAGDLSGSALDLLGALGYRSDLRKALSKRTYAEFAEVFVRNNARFNAKNALTTQWDSVDLLFQLTADQLTRQDSLFKNEKVDNAIIESYLFFVIELKAKPTGYTRTELSQITREVNKLFAMPAMLLFKHGDTITLSVIDRRLHKRDDNKDVLEKVTLIKDIRTSNPHRAHVEILFDLSIEELRRVHGFTTFPDLHRAWQKTLDTKELNRRFFRELANWYFHAVEVAEFPDDIEKDREKRNATSIIRLITRLMFVWFLREKDLVPEDLFDPKALKRILKPVAKGESNYYKAILQNLFFATLNTEMGKRKFRSKAKEGRDPHYFIHNVFRYEDFFADPKATLKNIFDPIPFLNGGLFECLDKDKEVKANGKPEYIRVDGFSDHPKNKLHVPDKLFFDPVGEEWDSSKVYDLKKPKKERVRGLIDILSSYKFTIVENTPIEEEVALDPELLGKVFENLLANFNPETKTTARKQTGSFYTPREIVNYMVDESLIAYLQNSIERSEESIKRLRHLLSYTEEPHPFNKKESEQLIAAIDACKILDPACGSGAFPMGVLHKLVHVLHKLDPKNTQWKERQIEKAAQLDDADIRERTIADIEDAFANNALDYGRKLYLIENGIYGVDIQPIAMQIAKLRFFISLIVDQRARPFDAVKSKDDNRGVRALPNLETKFVAANTLVRLHAEKRDLFTNPDIDDKKARLKRVRHDYFEARTPQRKEKCRQQDKKLREQLAELLMLNHEFQPKEAKMLAAWDPYDQNASAPFFDPEWMFGAREGFDVVIGNPPYVKEDLHRDAFMGLHGTEYYQGKMDLWTYFGCLGIDFVKVAGVVTFIAPNNWVTNAGARIFRNKVLDSGRLLNYVDFRDYNVFESASIQTMVYTYQKGPAPKQYTFHYRRMIANPVTEAAVKACLNGSAIPGTVLEYPVRLNPHALHNKMLSFNESSIEHIVEKLERVGTYRLPDSCIGNGIDVLQDFVSKKHIERLSGNSHRVGDGILVLSEAEIDRLKLSKKERAWLKPYYDSSQIGRYTAVVANEKWILYATKEFREAIHEYPNLKRHLDQFRPILTSVDAPYGLHRPREERFFTRPGVFGQRKAARPCFSYVPFAAYVTRSFLIIQPTDIDLKLLTAVLNSSVAEFWFQNRGKLQGSQLQIDKEPLMLFPVAAPTTKVKAQLEKLVEKRLGLNAGGAAEKVEREIDQVVYGLYGLTEEEIGIVEGSRKKDKGPVTAEAPAEE